MTTHRPPNQRRVFLSVALQGTLLGPSHSGNRSRTLCIGLLPTQTGNPSGLGRVCKSGVSYHPAHLPQQNEAQASACSGRWLDAGWERVDVTGLLMCQVRPPQSQRGVLLWSPFLAEPLTQGTEPQGSDSGTGRLSAGSPVGA